MSVIIPSWNAGDVLERCLKSLEGQRIEGGFETIVVDNASTDDTPEVLARHADAIRTIVNERNVGFSAANNQAARAAGGRVLFFLNSDTELLAPDVLARLATAAETPGIGIAGPLLLNPDGTLQPSCAAHPSVARAVLVSTGLMRLLPDRMLATLWPDFWSHDRATDTGWMTGAALAVRADLFADLGGFWPVLYGEEQDFARKAQARGLRARFVPEARVMHVGDHSLGQRNPRPRRAALVARADLAFLRAHYTRPRATAIRLIMGTGYAARAVALAALGQSGRAREYRAMAGVYARGM